MIKRNDGISEDDICQNQFTAYVLLAVKRKRQSYIKKKQRDTLEMVERITYLYQDFRDKAVELVTPVMDNVIAECIRLLTEKSSQEDRIYVLHLAQISS